MIIGVCVTQICAADRREKTGCALEEMARGDWAIGPRAYGCEYLAAFDSGKVVGVWRIDRTKGNQGWMSPTVANRVGLPPKFQAARNAQSKPFRKSLRACCLLPVTPAEGQTVRAKIGNAKLHGSIRYF